MDTLEEVRQILKKIALSQAKTDEQLTRLEEQQTKTDAQLAKTDARLSGLGLNIGQGVEELFYDALDKTLTIGKIKFDSIGRNIKASKKDIQDEFDIVLYNSNSVALVEIKHKVHPNDLDNLTLKKTKNFRTLFPLYKDFQIYLAIGGMTVPDNIVNEAQKLGVAVLKQNGNITTLHDEGMIAY